MSRSPRKVIARKINSDEPRTGCGEWFMQIFLLGFGLLMLLLCIVGLIGVSKFRSDIMPNLQMTGAVNAQSRARQYDKYFDRLRNKKWDVVSRGPFVIEGKFLYIWQARNPITGEKKVYRWRFDQVTGKMDALTDDAKELDRELKFSKEAEQKTTKESTVDSYDENVENIEVPPETTSADEPVPADVAE